MARAPASSPSSSSLLLLLTAEALGPAAPPDRAAPPGPLPLPTARRWGGPGGRLWRGWTAAASHLNLSATATAILPPLPRLGGLRPLSPGPGSY